MSVKLTYEEIERRIRELEEAESKRKQVEKMLRDNENFLNEIVENIPNMIFIKDAKELRFVRFNKAGEDLLGYSRDEMIGKNDYDFFSKAQADSFTAKDREVLKKGVILDVPKETIQTRSKGERILHTKKIPIINENGQPIYLLGISEDITERVRAERAIEKRILALTQPLASSEGITFEELFNIDEIQQLQDKFAIAARVASIITRPDGMPITKPSNFCRLCQDVIRKTDKGRANCYKSDAVLGKLNLEGPTIQLCLSGGLWDAGAGISIGGRHIANWLIGQVRDETQSEEKMRVYAGEIGADENVCVEAFREVPSMSRKQFGRVAQALFTLANQLSTMAYQNVQQARFISRLKRSEKEQMRLQSQLNQAQKMEAVGRLAGGVAHDFNNMLSVIMGHSEMALLQLTKDQPLYEILEEIKEAGRRSAELTRQLLAFARKQTVAPKSIDLNKTVAGITGMLQRLIGEDVDLAWNPEKNVWPVKVDPSQIDQILVNLCVNARDAISDVGKITIETKNIFIDEACSVEDTGCKPGEYVLLAVSDNGCGIEPETMKHLFEPFFTTKVMGKGTGLGLATVYGSVKQSNGFIYVHSEPGQGTTFKILFPRHFSQTAKSQEDQPDQAAMSGQETILLVEDEPSLLNMTKIMLEKQGYTVIAAGTPSEAIRVAKAHSGMFQLLVVDVIMPEMNGRELVKNILSLYPDLKYLYMSGYTDDVIVHHGVLEEGVHFIQKPFSITDLGAKVRDVLDRKEDGAVG